MFWRDVTEKVVRCVLFLCAAISILTTVGVVIVLSFEVVQFFQKVSFADFFLDTEWTPLFATKRFGIWPLIAGTFLTSLIAICVALPLGLLIAVYLSEMAPWRLRNVLKPILEILAGVPTVVYGYFALLFVTPTLRYLIPDLAGFNALSPGLVMGIMILPMVASLSEDALRSVPNSFREGSYALGSTKLQMIITVLIPAAMGGIIASFMLAVSRAVGETMIVAIAAGQQPVLTLNPTQAVETMTAYIVQVSLGDTPHGTIEYNTIFAVGMMLFLITFGVNWISIAVREHFRKKYR